MILLILSFLVGIIVVQQMADLPGILWLIGCFVAMVIAAYWRHWKAACFVAGIFWGLLFASARLSERLPEQLAGEDIQIQGTVADLPEIESNHLRFNFVVAQSEKPIPIKIRLTWYYPDKIVKAGQVWRLTARLKPPHGNFNPGGFDYERWLFTEGIGATGYVRTKPEPIQLGSASGLNGFYRWRQAIADKLEETLAGSDSLSMIKALTIGDGDSLSPQHWEIFRKTGTTHLMVISGSHIGLAAGMAYLLTLRIWARTGILACSPQKAAALVAMVVAFFYAGLTGFSVPAQRAALMLTIAMLAIVQQRNTRPYTILAVALLAVLAVDPLVVLSPGFWLSFIAVSLIIFVIGGRLGRVGIFRAGIKINWVTSIGLSPLLLFFFQQVSLISPLANLIAVPIISLAIVPMALVATTVMFINPVIAGKLFFPVDRMLQGLWRVLLELAELPLATLNHSQPSWWTLGFALSGILLLFAPKGMSSRWLGLIMLLPLLGTETGKMAPGKVKLTLLDVGQGLSAVVQTENHVLVYDTGAKFSSASDSGQSVIVPFLRSQGIDKVDTLVVSHGDNDHIGGAGSIVAAMDTGILLTSVPTQLIDFKPIRCQVGQSWLWDKVRFTILSPILPDKIGRPVSDNDNSCVLQIQSPHGAALLTGDIEAEAESWLVETYGDKLKANVLVAPHHGSQTSSTPNFLGAVKPDLILIPAGYRNPFGHPHLDVIGRYRNLSVKWLNNAEAGAVFVTMDKSLKVESWREKEGRYWNFKN